jgi:hypothetical protein
MTALIEPTQSSEQRFQLDCVDWEFYEYVLSDVRRFRRTSPLALPVIR